MKWSRLDQVKVVKKRKSGRTVRMLADALNAVVQGKSVVVVANQSWFARELERRIRDAADKLGVDDKYIKITHTTDVNSWKNQGRTFYVDHSVHVVAQSEAC